MPGTANSCDKELLNPGSSCIIVVNSVNNPEGTWWGEVTSLEEVPNGFGGTYLHVEAKITGGRFYMTENWATPIRSDERMNDSPSVNYRVFPDTDTTRYLFEKLRREHNASSDAIISMTESAMHWKNAFLETIEHLVKKRAIDKTEADEAKKAGGRTKQ